jgi:L,D-peptidoglycan transpeptidase YkuD (ErfK/YbiS/YcfS/YnhG family)
MAYQKQKIKNFKSIIYLFILFFTHQSYSFNENNIIIRCKENTFRCKGYFKDKIFDVNIGKKGIISQEKKKEGDLSTPIGIFQIQNILFYKKEKIQTKFQTLKIKDQYKWCDDSKSKIYNKFFILNKKNKKTCRSYENLMRKDHLYNFIIPTEYNIKPAIPFKGSAIFIHVKSENNGTAGCIAFEENDLKFIIKNLENSSKIIIEKL